MERAAFLIKPEDVRISCLLNPETIVVKRNAGVRPRQSIGGPLTGRTMADAPLLFTGGGHTWMDMELLFDVNLPGSTMVTRDVRDLSGPFFRMAENDSAQNGYAQPPVVRLVWGKSWNIPGVITHAAEKLECFNASGVPSRSWMKLRLRRVAGENEETGPSFDWAAVEETYTKLIEVLEQYYSENAAGGADAVNERSVTCLFNESLDLLAEKYYGNPALWRFIAIFNGISDPFAKTWNRVIRIPPLSELVKKI
ncbi:MAG: hypothetical protein K9J85_06835 [Desulfobacteraceae bacterium]|nr:hypothetical protein [Desulfobacteraceae bacterium]